MMNLTVDLTLQGNFHGGLIVISLPSLTFFFFFFQKYRSISEYLNRFLGYNRGVDTSEISSLSNYSELAQRFKQISSGQSKYSSRCDESFQADILHRDILQIIIG